MPSGIEILLDALAEHEIHYLFGNPGTTELPLNAAVARDSRFQYVLALQETPLMAIADGYSLASRKPSFINLHACCGLGNAMGMLYNAFREGTPLLVTAGQQDTRMQFREPILGGDMVSVTRPWTKWSYEVTRVADLGPAVRRAIAIATTPSTGPVFLALPLDVQMATCDQTASPYRQTIDHGLAPAPAAIERAASLLRTAKNPVILGGARVVERNAASALSSLASYLGAPIYAEPGSTLGRMPVASDDPFFRNRLPFWAHEITPLLAEHDCVIAVGFDLFREYLWSQDDPLIPSKTRLIQIDDDARQLGKSYHCEAAVWGDMSLALSGLESTLRGAATPEFLASCHKRCREWSAKLEIERNTFRTSVQSAMQNENDPISPLALMGAVAETLPANVAVIDEAVTTSNATLQRLGAIKSAEGYFAHRGWALGWGLGCSIGVKLAWPDRAVLAILGDGASMYGIQGLWTAAKYSIPVTFLICNNREYRILKDGTRGLRLAPDDENSFIAMDLDPPTIDFVGLSRSLGVESIRATTLEQVSDWISRGFRGQKPLLIEVPIVGGEPLAISEKK